MKANRHNWGLKLNSVTATNKEIIDRMKKHQRALHRMRLLAQTDPNMAALLKRLGWGPKEEA